MENNTPHKDPAAVALGKKRWANKSKEERSAHMRKMILTRHSKKKSDVDNATQDGITT